MSLLTYLILPGDIELIDFVENLNYDKILFSKDTINVIKSTYKNVALVSYNIDYDFIKSNFIDYLYLIKYTSELINFKGLELKTIDKCTDSNEYIIYYYKKIHNNPYYNLKPNMINKFIKYDVQNYRFPIFPEKMHLIKDILNNLENIDDTCKFIQYHKRIHYAVNSINYEFFIKDSRLSLFIKYAKVDLNSILVSEIIKSVCILFIICKKLKLKPYKIKIHISEITGDEIKKNTHNGKHKWPFCNVSILEKGYNFNFY